jgi:hypothetical protein
MLLLVQRIEICTISLDSPDYTNFVVPLSGIKHAIGIDYDPVDGYLYWTDDEVNSVAFSRAHLFVVMIFCDVMMCSLIERYRYMRATCCFQRQSESQRQQVALKCWYLFTNLHDVSSQKAGVRS